MSDEVIAPGEAPEPERNETPEVEPETTQTPAEKMKELQRTIKELNDQRPEPEYAREWAAENGIRDEFDRSNDRDLDPDGR